MTLEWMRSWILANGMIDLKIGVMIMMTPGRSGNS